MVRYYTKKPIPIQAIQWDGTNTSELMRFSKDIRFVYHEDTNAKVATEMYVKTLEGDLYARLGDYIIKGIKGEVYPCAKEIFEETYEEVNDVLTS